MATQTVEQVARLAPFQEQYLKDIFAQAKALGDTPQPFAEQQLAGLSGGQQAAIQTAMSGIGGYQPYMDRAQQYASPEGVSQFFNPYENQVVQQTLSDIGEQGQIAQSQLGGQGVASGAFGGSRFGVAQAGLAGDTLEQQARSAGQLRQAGFSQAQQAAQRAAQLQGALGQSAQAMGVQDVNTLMGIGSLQQQQEQRGFDVDRANLLAQQALPFQQVGFMSDIFRGVPQLTGLQQTSQAPSPNMMTTGIGLLGAGLSGGFFN
jgi:hypothetical protein